MHRFTTRPVRWLCGVAAALALAGGGLLAASAGAPATAAGKDAGAAVTRMVSPEPVPGKSATRDADTKDADTKEADTREPGAAPSPTLVGCPSPTSSPAPVLTKAPGKDVRPAPSPSRSFDPDKVCWAWIWP